MSGQEPVVIARNPLLGFGKVTIRLCGGLVSTHLLAAIFPSLVVAFELVPANTIMAHFFIWNLLTAAFLETSFFGVLSAAFQLSNPPDPRIIHTLRCSWDTGLRCW
jgi:hypothetical protein